MQPSIILACLALSTLIQSSETGFGSQGREKAMVRIVCSHLLSCRRFTDFVSCLIGHSCCKVRPKRLSNRA